MSSYPDAPAANAAVTPVRHRSKVAAALLACLLGVWGAHWWYMGRRGAWVLTAFALIMLAWSARWPVWWDSPPFLVLIVPLTAGIIESVVFALRPDEAFDARYNVGSGRRTRTGWNAVLVAIFATLMGGTAALFLLAVIVLHVYKALGWLDGYVI